MEEENKEGEQQHPQQETPKSTPDDSSTENILDPDQKKTGSLDQKKSTQHNEGHIKPKIIMQTDNERASHRERRLMRIGLDRKSVV